MEMARQSTRCKQTEQLIHQATTHRQRPRPRRSQSLCQSPRSREDGGSRQTLGHRLLRREKMARSSKLQPARAVRHPRKETRDKRMQPVRRIEQIQMRWTLNKN